MDDHVSFPSRVPSTPDTVRDQGGYGTMAEDMVGQRVAYWRTRRGWSQQKLGLMVDRSREWVCKLENGHITVGLRSDLDKLAVALGVYVTQLTGQPAHPRTAAELATMTMLPMLRGALLDDPIETRPVTRDVVGADVATAMRARMACDYQTLAAVLPRAISDSRVMVAAADPDGYRFLVRATVCASLAVRPMGHVDLALVLAQSAEMAALELGEGPERAAAAYCAAQHAVASGTPGGPRRSLSIADRAADALGDTGDDPAVLTWRGMLRLQGAMSSALLGHPEDSEERLVEADRIAARVVGDPWQMECTRTNVEVWRVNCLVEGGDYRRVPKVARAVSRHKLRTPQRRAHLLIGAGRAHAQLGRRDDAVAAFLEARHTAADELRMLVAAQETIGQLVRDAGRGAPTHLVELAEAAGVDPFTEPEDPSHNV